MTKQRQWTQEQLEAERHRLELEGIPVCPECSRLMDKVHPQAPIREGGWTPRTCPACGRNWRVEVRDDGESRRISGYTLRFVEPDPEVEAEETEMSTKSKTTKASVKDAPKATKKSRKATTPDPDLITDPTPAEIVAQDAPVTPTEAPTTPAEDLVVFAFRLGRAERDLIHAAAGSAKASKFVRELAVAAARQDREAIEQILTGVQTNR